MKIPGLLVVVLLLVTQGAWAQDSAPSLDDLLQSAQDWAQQNLDTNVLAALQDVDQQKVNEFFTALQQRFQGEYVLDLAALKPTVNALLPLLDAHEETQPYAAWLRANLDYLDVADALRRTAPPPKVTPGQPPPPVPNPTPAQERKAWKAALAQRPLPVFAADYLPRLKPIFVAERVPAELVWVAEVESAFNPKARSPAGAAGLFQLMPATARRFGLSRWPRDQRYQPDPSARAAAQYLRTLHARFGDWPLALAAYNAGEGTVQKLLDRYHAHSFDRIAPHLPAETQMYVPRIEATVLRREGVSLAQLKSPRA